MGMVNENVYRYKLCCPYCHSEFVELRLDGFWNVDRQEFVKVRRSSEFEDYCHECDSVCSAQEVPL